MGFLPQTRTLVTSWLLRSVLSIFHSQISYKSYNTGPGPYTEHPSLFVTATLPGHRRRCSLQGPLHNDADLPSDTFHPFLPRTGRTLFMVLFSHRQEATCTSGQSATLKPMAWAHQLIPILSSEDAPASHCTKFCRGFLQLISLSFSSPVWMTVRR